MSATTVLERPDGRRFQVDSGPSDLGGALRFLAFSVPETNDSVRLDWDDTADFTAGGTVKVTVRIGTLPAQQAAMTQSAIISQDTSDKPHFGPSGEAILRALAEAFRPFVEAHRDALQVLDGRVPKWLWLLHGRVPKFANESYLGRDGEVPSVDAPSNGLAATVTQYAAAGSSLGGLITGTAEGAAVGAVLGAAAGAAAYLSE